MGLVLLSCMSTSQPLADFYAVLCAAVLAAGAPELEPQLNGTAFTDAEWNTKFDLPAQAYQW